MLPENIHLCRTSTKNCFYSLIFLISKPKILKTFVSKKYVHKVADNLSKNYKNSYLNTTEIDLPKTSLVPQSYTRYIYICLSVTMEAIIS